MYSKILISLKSCCKFISVAGDVATEFKWYYDLIRNPRVSFSGHINSEAIQVDETFVEIHAEDDTDFEYQPADRPGTDTDMSTDMDLMTVDNDWASQGFDFLSRRALPRSQQPRFTNPNQLSRGSCFF